MPIDAWSAASPREGWCARGIDAHASDDVAEASITVISVNAERLRAVGLSGDPVVVPADAPATTHLLRLIGRDPSR